MQDAAFIQSLQQKYRAILLDLDERGTRRWAAAEAMSIGWGGVTAVAKATGISDRTIRTGIAEIKANAPLEPGRQRRPGGGRKSREAEQPGLEVALDKLIEPATRGDPRSPLRWTIKSTRTLARELKQQGFTAGSTKIAEMLKAKGYSLQSNRKSLEGKQHPDRNAQFEFIARRFRSQARKAEPSISVDTKKKEVLGNHRNPGKILCKSGAPIQVDTHDFPNKKLGKAIPYGV
jgi:hypothetical protein